MCVGLVVLGGIQRIAKVSEVIVPFMAVLYVGLAVIIIIANITAVPAALASIVKSAFTGSALAGGAVGSVFVAMQKGVARGIFSNESGLGSAPIAAAAARTKEPVRQGLVSMTGTFIDTIVICTMTGLSIVIAGSWLNPELEGVAITMDAFQKGLPFPSFVATFSLMLCLVFFAFTTILGWNYYGERCVEYLFNRNKGSCNGISYPVYPCSIHWTIYDSKSSMEYRGYLQCTDGIPEPDCTSCIERSDRQRDKRFPCKT